MSCLLLSVVAVMRTGSLDLGVVAAKGTIDATGYYNTVAIRTRVGPELLGSLFFTRGWSVGLGLGYQGGWYSGELRRHEFSSRAFVRHHFYFDDYLEHVFSLGTQLTLSARTAGSRIDPINGGATTSVLGRLSLFLSWSPSIRLTDNVRLNPEVFVAWGPALGRSNFQSNAEYGGRLGVERRF